MYSSTQILNVPYCNPWLLGPIIISAGVHVVDQHDFVDQHDIVDLHVSALHFTKKFLSTSG